MNVLIQQQFSTGVALAQTAKTLDSLAVNLQSSLISYTLPVALAAIGLCIESTYETLFGLMASTGLRVSDDALHLRDADADLKRGMLTIRQTKFAKSRQLPIHPCTVKALARPLE